MRCPACSENVLFLRFLRRGDCPNCRLPLRVPVGATPDALAQDEAALLVGRPTPRADWWWLLAGCLVTIALSALPSGGVATGLLLPLFQLYVIERATRRARRLFPFLHGLTFDLLSGVIFIALVFAEASAGVLAGPFAAVFTVPAFVLAWLLVRAVARSHLVRVAEGRPPHLIERAALTISIILLVAPPAVLAGTFLITASGSGVPEAPSAIHPDVFFETMSSGAILATDLFLLPLWACIGLLAVGAVPAPTGAGWVASWWVLALVSVALAAEVVLDNALDRRKRFSRTTWPRIQYMLTPFTVLAIVLVLGHELSWLGKGLAFIGAVGLGGLIKFGATETVKNATSLLPGALAQRKALLYSAPFRIVGAVGLALVASQAPLIATVLVCLVASAAAGMLLFQLFLRRFVRRRARLACTGCGHRPLETARLCPACHQPVIASRVSEVPEPIRKPMLQVAVAMAWADGGIDPEEALLLASACRAAGLPPDDAEVLRQSIAAGVTLDVVGFDDIPPKHRETVLDLATSVAIADGAAGPAERELWRDLATRLAGTGRATIRLPKKMTAWFTA